MENSYRKQKSSIKSQKEIIQKNNTQWRIKYATLIFSGPYHLFIMKQKIEILAKEA